MMIDALLDPFIVSVPEAPSPEEAQSFMDRLVRWSRSANENGFRLVVSKKSMKIMYDNDHIPSYDRLKVLCSVLDPKKYDAESVNNVVSKLLFQWLDDPITVKDVLLDDASTSVVPEDIISRLNAYVNQPFIETLAAYALNKELSSEGNPHYIITDSAKSDALSGTFKIDHAVLSEPSDLTFPSLINNEWTVVDDVEPLLASLDGECETLTEAIKKVEEEFLGDLVFLPRAHDSASDYRQYQQPQKGYHALKVLGEVCRLYRRNQLGSQDIAAAVKGRLGPKSFAPDVSQSLKNSPKGSFDVMYKGQRQQLGPHIILGGGKKNNRNLLRIYFLIDEDSKFVIGHVGEHLD
jgi:hypothetical protein